MNSTSKWIIAIVAILGAVCLCAAVGGLIFFRSTGWAIQRTFQSDPQKVADVSATIAEYTLPDGFEAGFVTDMAGFSMVSHTGTDGHSHIYFFQLPAGVHVDPAEMERQFRQSARNQNPDWSAASQVVDEVAGTINGQEVTLIVSEGTNSDGAAYRAVSTLFQGRGGQAMVVFERPVDSWDQAEVDEFLASIH
jgi:hypothetical protein